jgi:hypothetical protein
MVKLSSLHDEGRPVEVLYHYRRDTLAIALQMGVSSSISECLFGTFAETWLGGN